MKNIDDNPEDYRYDLTNCSSGTECTGLMYAPPQSDEDLKSYNEIYHFALPEIDKNSAFCDTQKGQR